MEGNKLREPLSEVIDRLADCHQRIAGECASSSLAGELGHLRQLLESLRLAEESAEPSRLAEVLQSAEMARQKYQELFDRAPVALFVTASDGSIRSLNAAAGLMFGEGGDSLRGKPISSLVVEEDRPLLEVHLAANGTAQRNGTFQLRMHRHGRGELTAAIDVQPAGDLDREAATLCWFVRDVTETVRVRQELEGFFTLLRAMLDSMSDGLLVIDAAGRMSLWNRKFLEMWRIPHGVIAAQDFSQALEVMTNQLRDPGGLPFRLPETNGSRRGAVECQLRDGRTVVCEGHVERHAGESIRRLWTFRDVTQERIARETLRESESKFRAIFHGSLDPVAINSLGDGRYLDINREFLDLTGYAREELIGRTPAEIRIWVNTADLRAILPDLRARRPVRNREAEFRMKDGRVVYALFSATVVDLGGQPAIVSFLRDITARRQAEEKLQRWNQELERRVAERTAELEGANAALREENAAREQLEEDLLRAKAAAETVTRMKSALLANASHEIRNPVNTILGMGDLLAETMLEGEQARYVEMLRRSAAALLGLVNDLLDLSRAEAGRIELETIDFDLRELALEAAASLEIKARGKGVDLRTTIAANVPENVRGDPSRLRQVLVNLLGNAVKFTERGSVSLTVEPAAGPDNRALLRFTVSDTGLGIAPERLEAIFEPFSQADPSVSRQYGGSGLGLTIARRLVEQMGGEIEVESTPGKGSTFRFSLPVGSPSGTTSAAISHEGDAGTSPSAPAGLRILIAEDVADNRALVELYLRETGSRVDMAENGEAAVRKFRSGRYDLVLMDLRMPVMDGLTAARKIRDWEQRQGRTPVPIVALTAASASEEREQGAAAGCTSYLTKPIRKKQLLAAIREIARPVG